MSKETNLYHVAIHAPANTSVEEFKFANNVLMEQLARIRDNEDHMRGFILAANNDGFPVKAGFATKAQLEELCVRAFWWKFERIIEERKLS